MGRIFLAIVMVIALGGNSEATAEQLRLTVDYLVFESEDPALAAEFEKVRLDNRDTQAAVLDKLYRAAKIREQETLSSVVTLDQKFELRKVEGNRTFKVDGVLMAYGKTVRTDITPHFTEIATDRFVNGQPARRERWTGLMAELDRDDACVLSTLTSTTMTGDRMNYQIAVWAVRLQPLKR